MNDLYADVRKDIATMAAKAFANHVLTVEGPSEWHCGKPGTGIMAFHVLCRPGMIAVWGDLGEWVLRVSDKNPLAWLPGAVRSPDYLLEKVQAGEKLGFYEADARALLDDPETIEDWCAATVERIKQEIEYADPLTLDKWLEACADASLDDPPLVEYPTRGALWLVEMLRKFVELELTWTPTKP